MEASSCRPQGTVRLAHRRMAARSEVSAHSTAALARPDRSPRPAEVARPRESACVLQAGIRASGRSRDRGGRSHRPRAQQPRWNAMRRLPRLLFVGSPEQSPPGRQVRSCASVVTERSLGRRSSEAHLAARHPVARCRARRTIPPFTIRVGPIGLASQKHSRLGEPSLLRTLWWSRPTRLRRRLVR